MGQPENLSGQKFDRLTAIKYIKRPSEHGKWFCKCDCGGVKEVSPGHLKDGHTKSCGCLVVGLDDLTGQRFDKLSALKYVGASMWLCQCDCGNEKEVW